MQNFEFREVAKNWFWVKIEYKLNFLYLSQDICNLVQQNYHSTSIWSFYITFNLMSLESQVRGQTKYYVPPLRETRDFSFKEFKNALWKYMYEIDLNEVLLYK